MGAKKPAAPPQFTTSSLVQSSAPDFNRIIEKVPIRFIQQGRVRNSDILLGDTWEFSPQVASQKLTEHVRTQIREDDRALAATTPILGQYAPSFGWSDDWGWYWEYLDAYLFVPEVAYAVKLKTRQVWKPGFEINTGSDSMTDQILKEYKKRKIKQSLFEATKNALIWGNSYIESVDDSQATWSLSNPADVAQGVGYQGANIMYAPRPLVSFTPATQFYGLKNTDPRSFRIQIQPQQWDKNRATVLIDKYIQRRWSGPLAPTAVLGSETEIDFHPEQMFCLQFNKITGGIYGYSTFRETLFALKGYLTMLQYLPGIVGKRADKTLLWKFGGTYFDETHQQISILPPAEQILQQKTTIEARQPTEDVWVNFLVQGEELYKAGGTADSISNYLQAYKERVLLGMGIPMAAYTSGSGNEIKWGSLQFEMMEDETRENQEKIEDLHMDYVIPRLLLNLKPGRQLGDGPEVDVQSQPPRK